MAGLSFGTKTTVTTRGSVGDCKKEAPWYVFHSSDRGGHSREVEPEPKHQKVIGGGELRGILNAPGRSGSGHRSWTHRSLRISGMLLVNVEWHPVAGGTREPSRLFNPQALPSCFLYAATRSVFPCLNGDFSNYELCVGSYVFYFSTASQWVEKDEPL